MTRVVLVWIVLVGALLAPTTSVAQIACTRDGLQRAVDKVGNSAATVRKELGKAA